MDPQGALSYEQLGYSMMHGSGSTIGQDGSIPTSLVAAGGGVPYGGAYLGASPAGSRWQPPAPGQEPALAAPTALTHLPQQHSLSSLGSSGSASAAAALADAHSGQLDADAAAAAAAAAQMLAASRAGSFPQPQQPQGAPGGPAQRAGFPGSRQQQPRGGQYR